MEKQHHDQIAKWERRWIAGSGLMSLLFVILIAYSLATEGAHIAQSAARGNPEQLLAQQVFAEPGARQVGPNRYEVSLVGQTFNWTPDVVRVPVGAEITFYLTARDVIHGWQVENTNLNVEVIPGEVSRLVTTFDEVGTYRISCNEYCGLQHQAMVGWLEVVPASQVNATLATGPLDGPAVYARNCASCHGAQGAGVAGSFPPLAGHAADLAAVAGGRTYLINALLYGLQGQIVVDGRSYNGNMPAWNRLRDEEIALVLDHVVTWDGGEDPGFTPAEIAAERGRGRTAADVLALRLELALP